jgi:predicted small integral membrane protein
MTTQPAYAGGDPRQALWQAQELARGVRRAQRATWFPLLVFAAVTLAAIPVYRYGHFAKTCRSVPAPTPGPGGRVCSIYSSTGYVYWPIALVLAYAAIAAFYLRRSRARGVGTRIRPYVVAGIVIAVALTAISLWEANHPPVDPRDFLGLHVGQGFELVNRLASPACAIGLALLVLAWAERNRALLAVTVGYLVIVLVPIDFGWVLTRPSPWVFLPRLVIDGGVLLLAGLGFAVAQRPAGRPAA